MPAFLRLANTLQRLKTPIQIFGLLIIVGGLIAYKTVPPEYVRGVFAAGSMGIFFLIFGQVFSALPNIPVRQRGTLVIILTLIFAFFTLGALVLTAYFVATAEAHTLPLRKVGEFVRPASQANVNDLVHYIEESDQCDFSIPDVQEAALILNTIKTSTNKDDVEFARSWTQEHNELQTAVCRLVLAYKNGSLLASNYSKRQEGVIETDIQHAKGPVVYGGDRARDMLLAVIEQGETDRDRINSYIAEAVSALVTVGYSKLYTDLMYIPQRYVELVDKDFLKFVKRLPETYFDIVKTAIYSNETGEFITFECDSPATSERSQSYSRFMVPTSSVPRQEILDKMKHGPWPVGRAQALFSEQWWLRNAIWQMLGREHGKYRAGLGIRINDFGQCGPP